MIRKCDALVDLHTGSFGRSNLPLVRDPVLPENADYLMEVMGAWQEHYRRAAFIDMGAGNGSAIEQQAQADAARRGWLFERVAGDLVLIRRLLAGDWEKDFLVLQPGEQLTITYDADIIGCVPANTPKGK